MERGAEIQEVEAAVRGDLAPRAVEVHLSRGGEEDLLVGDAAYEVAGVLRFDSDAAPLAGSRAGTARRARLKPSAHCSGRVRLVVHEPLVSGSGNPYRQVALASLELWGHEDSLPSRPLRPPPLLVPGLEQRDGDSGEVARVLLELGVPLNIMPMDEETHRLDKVDGDTRRLLEELHLRHPDLLKAGSFGEAQQLSEHMQQLTTLGAELRRLQEDRDRCLAARSTRDAERLSAPLQELQETRLSIAALYETDFWLDAMTMPPVGSLRWRHGHRPDAIQYWSGIMIDHLVHDCSTPMTLYTVDDHVRCLVHDNFPQ